MKRIFLSITAACLIFTKNATAQVDTSTVQKLLQYIMQPLDKNQIPTGFLEEYGCPMLPMATFNGTLTDSNRMDMHLWRTLYFQLQTGWTRTTSNPLPAITTVNTTIKNNSNDTILIPLLIGNYDVVKSNAFSSNLLSYNSSTKQVNDVSGRPESPYDTKNLFAASPLKNQTVRGTETFVIKSDAIWNNTGKTITQLQINFSDGNGFQTMTIGTPVTVSYTDTGYKRWTIKAQLSDNSVLQCYNDYYALVSSSGTARYQTAQTTIPAWGFVNVNSGATVWVNYSSLNRTNTLRKPLIVVEGYDVSNVAPSLQANYWIGDFISSINNASGYDFNDELDNIAGYDLVFIDFNNGTDDIINNAAIVQEVINRVNNNKVNDTRFGNIRQQNVVMGLSMGGLCARYALASMTKSSVSTETRLLITHDSPHRGANVPLGLQYMIRMMGGVELFGTGIRSVFPDYDDAIGLLDAPATQQLLLYRATTANSFASNTFLDGAYRSMITFNPSDPQPAYRFIATANGNECANPLFNPGKTFINLGAGVSAGVYGRLLFFRVPIVTYKLAAEVEAYALPATGSTNKIARVYTINHLQLFGFINIFKQLYNNTAYAPGSHLAVDGVPGSNYPLLDVEALNQLTSFPEFAARLYVSFPLGPFLGGYFGAYAYNAGVSYNFTFVPVGSALDVTPYSTNTFTQKYVNGTNQDYPSTAETFIAQETVQGQPLVSNNTHIRFTARNAHWLFNEMENLTNTLNCSSECSNPYYIQGQSLFCTTSGNYFIPGLQRGASVTWSVSPSTAATLSCTNCLSTTLTKNFDYEVTLTATIANACGGTVAVSKNIIVGFPPFGGPTGPDVAWPSGNYYYYATLPPGYPTPTSYFWTVPSGWTILSGQGTDMLYLNTGTTSGPVEVEVTACGVTRPTYKFVEIGSGPIWPDFTDPGGELSRFSVYPNPVSNTLSISSTKNSATISKKQSNQEKNTGNLIRQLQIINKNGKIVKQYNYGSGIQSISVDISGLNADLYMLRIFDGKSWHTSKIVVQH